MPEISVTSPAAKSSTTPPGSSGGPRRLDRESSKSLWKQLRDDISQRINAGEFAAAFPGEHALTEQYGVSRQTVRLALRSLREAGIISAARGQNSEVLQPPVEQSLGALYSMFSTVEAAGMSQKSVIYSLDERQDAYAANQLQLQDDDPMIFLHRLRLADDQPMALDQVWLPAEIARPLLDTDFTHTALYTELATTCGVHPMGGREKIDAVTVDHQDAQRLDVPPGSPAFSIQRITYTEDKTVLEWRTTLIRADRFRIYSRFSPTTGSQLAIPGAFADPAQTRR